MFQRIRLHSFVLASVHETGNVIRARNSVTGFNIEDLCVFLAVTLSSGYPGLLSSSHFPECPPSSRILIVNFLLIDGSQLGVDFCVCPFFNLYNLLKEEETFFFFSSCF